MNFARAKNRRRARAAVCVANGERSRNRRSGRACGSSSIGPRRSDSSWSSCLPINEIGGDHSPYNAISAVAIEPTTLHLAPGSPQDLTQEDFEEVVAEFDLAKTAQRRGETRSGPAVENGAARKGISTLCATKRIRTNFDQLLRERGRWLDDYVFFRALMEENGGRETWDQWREEHRTRRFRARMARSRARGSAADAIRRRERFFRYVQWIAYEQWQAITVVRGRTRASR